MHLRIITLFLTTVLFSISSSSVVCQPTEIEETRPIIKMTPIDRSVRFVYLISKDRQLNTAYAEAIKMAALSIQAWYKKQLGRTFKLNEPVVEIVQSNENASWFYANPNGDDRESWGYYNTYDEAKRLLNTAYNDPHYIWVIYSDGPGNKGRGGSGVCIMPEDDLLGLTGKHPTQPDINRWIAGLGHEAGHAFGLSHPKDTEKDADAIMWTGIYGKYPDICYLTPEDKEILNKSPFFFGDHDDQDTENLVEMGKYDYDDGYFTRIINSQSNDISWTETKKDHSAVYKFSEKRVDDNFYYIKSVDRELEIKIPIIDGQSYITSDGGVKWYTFETIKKIN